MIPESLPDHGERLAAARAVAQWKLGYPSWADTLIAAYIDPEAALRHLEEEKAKYSPAVPVAEDAESAL